MVRGLLFVVCVSLCAAAACSSAKATNPFFARPPDRPAAPATASTALTNLALHTVFFGDISRGAPIVPDGGQISNSAWIRYGYDLDGKITTRDSTDVCISTSRWGQPDGENGIDNSFGANILPILQFASVQAFTARQKEKVDEGDFTTILSTVGLADDPAQTSVGLSAQLFLAGRIDGGPRPAWNGQDNWPIRREALLDGGSVESGARTTFPGAYIVHGTWVGAASGDVTIRIAVLDTTIDLVIHHAIVSFEHPTTGVAANGTIAGILDPAEVVASARRLLMEQRFCGSAGDAFVGEILDAQDIGLDGTNPPGVPCTGISIGLGFTAEEIAPPTTIADPDAPTPVRCDGG